MEGSWGSYENQSPIRAVLEVAEQQGGRRRKADVVSPDVGDGLMAADGSSHTDITAHAATKGAR
jgi:hypothetical protein